MIRKPKKEGEKHDERKKKGQLLRLVKGNGGEGRRRGRRGRKGRKGGGKAEEEKRKEK